MNLTNSQKLDIIAKRILHSKAYTSTDFSYIEESVSSTPVLLNQIWKASNFIPQNNPLQGSQYVDGDVFTDGNGDLLLEKVHKRQLKPERGSTIAFTISGIDNIIPESFGDGSYGYALWKKDSQGNYTESISREDYYWILDSSSGVLIFPEEIPIGISEELLPAISCYRYIGESGNIQIGEGGIPGGTGEEGSSGPQGPIANFRMNFKDEWVITNTYDLYDMVTLSNELYVSLVDDNIGNSPDISPTEWKQLTYATVTGTFSAPDGVVYVSKSFSGRQHPFYDNIKRAISDSTIFIGYDTPTIIEVFPGIYEEDITMRNECYLYLHKGAEIVGTSSSLPIMNFPNNSGASGIYGNGIIGRSSTNGIITAGVPKNCIEVGWQGCNVEVNLDAVYANGNFSVFAGVGSSYSQSNPTKLVLRISRSVGPFQLGNIDVRIEGCQFASSSAMQITNCNLYATGLYLIRKNQQGNPDVSLQIFNSMNTQRPHTIKIENSIFGIVVINNDIPGIAKYHINTSYFKQIIHQSYTSGNLYIEGFGNTEYGGSTEEITAFPDIPNWIGESPMLVYEPLDSNWINIIHRK